MCRDIVGLSVSVYKSVQLFLCFKPRDKQNSRFKQSEKLILGFKALVDLFIHWINF